MNLKKIILKIIFFTRIVNMTYIKKSLIIIILYTAALYSQDINFQDLYAQMKDKYSSAYPKHFEAYIKGKIVQRQIDTIPAKSYTKTKDDIKLKFSFSSFPPIFYLFF